MSDDLAGGEGTQPAGRRQRCAPDDAVQDTSGEQVAGAGRVVHRGDCLGFDRRPLVAVQQDGALGAERDGGDQSRPREGVQRPGQVVCARQALSLLLVREEQVDLCVDDLVQQAVITIDEKRVRQAQGHRHPGGLCDLDRTLAGCVGTGRVEKVALEIEHGGFLDPGALDGLDVDRHPRSETRRHRAPRVRGDEYQALSGGDTVRAPAQLATHAGRGEIEVIAGPERVRSDRADKRGAASEGRQTCGRVGGRPAGDLEPVIAELPELGDPPAVDQGHGAGLHAGGDHGPFVHVREPIDDGVPDANDVRRPPTGRLDTAEREAGDSGTSHDGSGSEAAPG